MSLKIQTTILPHQTLETSLINIHLDLTYSNEHFNPRYAFGSQRDRIIIIIHPGNVEIFESKGL